MIISLQQSACYCIVSSPALSEVSSLFFYHRFFSDSNLQVRMAVASTICAGDSRRPTIHRMLICEPGTISNAARVEFAAAQLLLNDAQIRISEKRFNELAETNEQLAGLFGSIKGKIRSAENVFTIEESDILTIPGYGYAQLVEAITKLRLNTDVQRYNKVGSKCDNMLYRYLFKTKEV